MKSIGFIGAGNMGFAIAAAILGSGVSNRVCCYDIDASKKERFVKIGAGFIDDLNFLVKESDVIVLSVKPQVFDSVLPLLAKTRALAGKLIVTIAAGITTGYVAKQLSTENIARIMPNTPLMVGEGASAVSFRDAVCQEDRDLVLSIFSASGVARVIDEAQMNDVVAVNGSSPAYVYLFAKAVIDQAEKSGIDRAAAKELFCKTLVGSAKMLLETDMDEQALIDMVCSPGGTTLAAMDVLYKNNFESIVAQAMEACSRRSKELQK